MALFHDTPFDDATLSKLKLFQGYIREWLPVFLTKYTGYRRNRAAVNVFDFFSGPGHDIAGNPGSPIIIVEELKQFCDERGAVKADDVRVRLVFNDVRQDHVEKLRAAVAKIACPKGCCSIEYSSLPFQEALQQHLPHIQRPDTANLVIMDQRGVKEVTPEVVRQLADCGATDIIFFISSSFIRRFIDTPELGGKFDSEAEEIKTVEYNAVHRYVCGYYREKLTDQEYYLTPFSIKKGRNIYGVIFGSGSLYGLEKFLKVCWKEDAVTGEANYKIDGYFAWAGHRSLFPQHNAIRKVDIFDRDLRQFIMDTSPDNREVYKFCLTHGFLPKSAKESLRTLQDKGELAVTEIATDRPARAFYLTQKGWKARPRVRFAVRSGQ